MSDEIRNALLEEFPEPPERDVILMQLKGDLIDTLSGLTAVGAESIAVTGTAVEAVAEAIDEPVVDAVADEAPVDEASADEVRFDEASADEVRFDEAAAEAATTDGLALAPDDVEGADEAALESDAAQADETPVEGPSSLADEILAMADQPADATEVPTDDPAVESKRGQTMQFFIDDLDLSKREE